MDLFGYVIERYIAARGWKEAMLPYALRIKELHDKRWRRKKDFLRKLKHSLKQTPSK
jgi:hypothetical protein